MTESADQLAQRFRTSRDVHALAELFDTTAPELLRVAHWLTGDLHAAEDVVQDTFLTYVDRADAQQRDRPVVPWLVGIAANLARRWRAQRARRRTGDPSRSSVDDPNADPAALAEVEELRAELAATIASLPRAYGQVLRLSIEHNLTPQEIARALDRPDGTVRSQLSRGLALLRQALPAGLVGGAAVLVTPGRGLAAVRHLLLSRVAPAAPVAASSVMVQLLPWAVAMKTSTLWISSFVLVVAAAATVPLWWGSAPFEPAPHAASAPVSVGEMSVESAGAAPGSAGLDMAPDRQPLRPVSEPTAAARVLRGRAVASESGAPLAGAEFELLATAADHAWSHTAAATTSGGDGHFALAVPEDAARDKLAVIGHVTGRVDVYGMVAQDDLGEVAFPRGPELELTVVDEDGVAVSSAWLAFSPVVSPTGAQILLPEAPVGRLRSDRDGRVEVGRVAAGKWRVRTLDPFRLLAPTVLDVPADRERFTAVVRLAGRVGDHVLEGDVVDANGSPVAGVDVTVSSVSLDMPSAVTDVDGHFRVLGTPATGRQGSPVQLQVYPTDAHQRPAPIDTEWGARGLRVVLQSVVASVLDVVVRDAVTGAPLPDFEVRCGHAWGGAVLEADSDPEMQLAVVRGVRVGSNFVTAFPRGSDYLPSETTRVDHTGGRAAVELAAHRAQSLRVRVQTLAGEPVVATRVELLRTPAWVGQWTKRAADVDWINDWRRAEPADNPDGYSHGPTLIDVAVTDARGEVVLRAAAGVAYGVRALGPGHAPAVLNDVVGGTARTIELEVATGARLVGRVEDADGVRDYGRLALISLDDDSVCLPNKQIESLAETAERIVGASATMALGADGSFDFRHLPPGRWRAVLEGFSLTAGRPSWNRVAFPDVLELRDGETRKLILDGSWLRMATLEGRLRLGGRLARSGRVVLEAREEGSAIAMSIGRNAAAGDLNAAGGFAFRALPAGRYRLWLQMGENRRLVSYCVSDWFGLQPGQRESLELDVVTTNLELQLTRSGEPLSSTVVWLRRVDGGETVATAYARSDADGAVRLQRLPPGAYAVRQSAGGEVCGKVVVSPAPRGEWIRATIELPRAR